LVSPLVVDAAVKGDAMVTGEIVHHDNVARFQNGRQKLLNPTAEQRTVDGSLDCEWSDEFLSPQGSENLCDRA
jgi:hypothetical protein